MSVQAPAGDSPMVAPRPTISARLQRLLLWQTPILLCRLLYHFRVVGKENIPRQGPFILVMNEYSPLALLISGWITQALLDQTTRQVGKTNTFSYMREDLFSLPYFGRAATPAPGQQPTVGGLLPQAAGPLAIGLLDGYRVLQHGGIVCTNPEGDMPWDGRPLPTRQAVSWLGLHTAAPLLLALCSVSAYDTWPRWQTRPSLRGRITLQIGKPFRLCETPMAEIKPDDLDRATARLRAELDRIRYGGVSLEAWAGPALLNRKPIDAPPALHPSPGTGRRQPDQAQPLPPLRKRGIGLLLWRCPLCLAPDTLRYERHGLRTNTVRCQSCGAAWRICRVIGHDFRLKLTEGPADLVGLEMALSAWYDATRRDLQPCPIAVSGAKLLPGEQVYLQTGESSLMPHRPSKLYEGWAEREAPRSQPGGRWKPGDWSSIGTGRLLLTSHRLLWQGPAGELDFYWSGVQAAYLWMYNTLFIRYGRAPYRLKLGEENGLKWLTYIDTFAGQAAQQDGHTLLPIHL